MFKNLLGKIAGKFIANKIQLEDGPVETKKWWKSKTIWAGVYVILRTAYDNTRELLYPGLPAIPPIVDTIVGTIAGAQVLRSRVSAPTNKPIG